MQALTATLVSSKPTLASTGVVGQTGVTGLFTCAAAGSGTVWVFVTDTGGWGVDNRSASLSLRSGIRSRAGREASAPMRL